MYGVNDNEDSSFDLQEDAAVDGADASNATSDSWTSDDDAAAPSTDGGGSGDDDGDTSGSYFQHPSLRTAASGPTGERLGQPIVQHGRSNFDLRSRRDPTDHPQRPPSTNETTGDCSGGHGPHAAMSEHDGHDGGAAGRRDGRYQQQHQQEQQQRQRTSN
jgi:hypothetical protein